MNTLSKILVATLSGAILSLSAATAFADGRGHERGDDRRYYDDRGGKHKHHRHYSYYRGPAVYAPYYAPAPGYYGPPPVVYQPGYYVPRVAPAVTIGISPIVIPLR